MAEDYTLWNKARPDQRDRIKDAAIRLSRMSTITYMGGMQPGEHAQGYYGEINNPCNIDWAVWELLIALRDAGYSQGPLS